MLADLVDLAGEVELRVHHLALDSVGIHGIEAGLRVEVTRVPGGLEIDEILQLEGFAGLQLVALCVGFRHAGVPGIVVLRGQVLLDLLGGDHAVRIGGEESGCHEMLLLQSVAFKTPSIQRAVCSQSTPRVFATL